MTIWQWVLAWILYLAATLVWCNAHATKFHPQYAVLDKTDWTTLSVGMAWWVGLGVLVTSILA